MTVINVIDGKYVVFKIKDLEDLQTHFRQNRNFGPHLAAIMEKQLDDATVIRGQDLLAAPLLDSYVGMLAIIIKGGNLPPDQQANLLQVSDYFHQRAEEARDLGYKLPD